MLNTVVASEAFVFLWLSTFLHSERSFESVNIIFIDGWMHSWILKSHCLKFLTCFFTVLFNSTYFCDNVMFAVCTCEMKERNDLFLYNIHANVSQAFREKDEA